MEARTSPPAAVLLLARPGAHTRLVTTAPAPQVPLLSSLPNGSQTLNRPSSPPETIRFESGDQSTRVTTPPPPLSPCAFQAKPRPPPMPPGPPGRPDERGTEKKGKQNTEKEGKAEVERRGRGRGKNKSSSNQSPHNSPAAIPPRPAGIAPPAAPETPAVPPSPTGTTHSSFALA